MANVSKKAVDSWWMLLKHLSADIRLELASRLINSLKGDKSTFAEKNEDWKKLYGVWTDEEGSAEDIIAFIRENRFRNRNIDTLD